MAGGVAIIKIDNPPFNTLTRDVRLRVKAALQSAIDNPVCKIILLVGTGRTFSVGADIKELASTIPLGEERVAMGAYVDAYNTHNASPCALFLLLPRARILSLPCRVLRFKFTDSKWISSYHIT